MNVTLVKASAGLMPVCLLLIGSVLLFIRRRSAASSLQLLGAACLVVVVLAHFAEALRVFPFMKWGYEQSAGHYLDLSCAVLGSALFPLGYLLHALAAREK